MIVVHGVVLADGRIALWAESAAAWGAAAESKSDQRHPFAVVPAVAGEPELVSLMLPTRSGSPVASPELGVANAAPVAGRQREWWVPAVVLAPGTDPEALLELATSVRPGSSIGYLADVVAFARDLVRRGRFLPGLADGRGGLGPVGADVPVMAARWLAELRGVDFARFEQLRLALPGVAMAASTWSTGQSGQVADGSPAAPALRAALDAHVDALVREQAPASLVPGSPASANSAVRAWLSGLTGDPTAVAADPGELATLREALERWHCSGSTAAVRTCFRLTQVDEGERDDEPAGWLLEFLLQPVTEPSVLIPAEEIWHDRASPLHAWVDYPHEVLLADLARASRLYPDLEDALRTERPIELFLDVAGAYRFLTHAPLLEEMGLGVLVPARWQRPTELGLTFTVHSRDAASPVLRDRTANLAAIVDFRWGLALGAEVLSPEELAQLARAKVPLVRLRGQWVFLDQRQLVAGLAFLARGGAGQTTAGEALRRVWLTEQAPLEVTGVGGTGWLADLLTGRVSEQLALIEPPVSLRTTLRPYQRRGLSWLAFLDGLGIGALLADDMGLGKTVQLLALEALGREESRRPPTLIVCPLSVLGNWQREIERFTPSLGTHLHHGADRTGTVPEGCDLVLTTYSVLTRDIEWLSQLAWDRIVLDEAQQVKNSGTATARAVRRLPARHRVALTGTPIENRLLELWSIVDFLNPGILGPASTFRARYSVPVERFSDESAAARLRLATRPLLLRRLKDDPAVIADLPEKIERTQWCTLTREQASLYQAVVDELRLLLTTGRPGNRRKGLVLAAMTKLKQVCNHPAQLLGDGSTVHGRSGKVTRLEQILSNALADGDRVLVFTQFVRLGTILLPHLASHLGAEVGFLHGGLAKGTRDRLVDRFQDGSGPPVMLISLKAGGTGLNLTAANQVVHIDRWWNPATEAQATDRAFRIGQRRNVQVHTFVCTGTIEERIDAMLSEKRDLAQLAVGSGEGWLTRLSTDDLLDLVRLAPPVSDD